MAKRSDAGKLGQPDWILLGTTAALLAVGMMAAYSASFDISYREFGDAAYFFKHQLMWLTVGAVAMFIVTQFHYRHWTKLSIPLMLITLGLLVALAISRKRLLFGQSVSPVELAKLTVVIYIGHWLASKRVEQLRRLPVGPLPFTIIVGIVAALVIAQPDLSEALVIVLVSVAMFFTAGADVFQFSVGILGGGAAFALVVMNIPYAMERFEPHMSGWWDPLNSSTYQLREGVIALGSGGILGLGPGNGRMKYLWLPAPHTDSIFAIVGEEMGLVGCLFIVLLFLLLAYRGFHIAQDAPDSFGRLLAIGITSWISLQALINMGVVTGIIPFAGIALPFISVGGSSLVTCMVGVGLMLSVSRASDGERVRSNRQAAQSPRAEAQPTGPGGQRSWLSQHRSSNLESGT